MIQPFPRAQARQLTGGATQMAATSSKTNPGYQAEPAMQGEMPSDDD